MRDPVRSWLCRGAAAATLAAAALPALAQFNMIPLAGGRNTIAGVVTGEMDFGVLPSGGIAAAGEAVRTLGIQ